jgi:hypothetical protein
MKTPIVKKLIWTAVLLSGIVLGGANAIACNGPHVPGPNDPVPACRLAVKPPKLIHLTYLPAQIDLKVGDTVVFAADGPQPGSNASNPAVTLDSPGSLRAVGVRYYNESTLRNRGDEERLWNAYEATQPGTFTATVTFSAAPGTAARTQTITITVTK